VSVQSDFFCASELVGISVITPHRCKCGSNTYQLGNPRGPHRAELRCSKCDRHGGWLPNAAANFLEQTIQQFARPTQPVLVREQTFDSPRPSPGAGGGCFTQARRQGDKQMDMSKYAGSAFLSLDDVQGGPIRSEIASVEIGNYDKPVLTFSNGLRFSLNVTNTTALIKEFGKESQDWIGESIELYAGETKYQGAPTPSVLVRPLTRDPDVEKPKPKPVPKPSNDMDDEIPFS
jgi:hypothetical protein